MKKLPFGYWGPSEEGCDCFELTKKCSKACSTVIPEFVVTELYVWKERSLCIEEITDWKYRESNTADCEDNYAACGTNLYCISNLN